MEGRGLVSKFIWHIYLTYKASSEAGYQFFRYFLCNSSVFSPLHNKNFDIDEKISCRIDESITPLYNTIHRLVWWVDKECELIWWIHFPFSISSLFSRENCIWSPCFLFITAWFSLDTSVKTNSWITLVCSLVYWE